MSSNVIQICPPSIMPTQMKNLNTPALATNLVIAATKARLISLTFYNGNAAARFLQLFDLAALPADATVPTLVFTVPALSHFTVPLCVYGRLFNTGIVACNSSTGATKTIGAADSLFDAQIVGS